MAITPKPFTRAQRLLRTIFKGKPNVFADVDLMRQDNLEEARTRHLAKVVGGGWQNPHPAGFAEQNCAYLPFENNKLRYELIIAAQVYEWHGSEFTVSCNFTGTTFSGGFPALRVYLAAKVERVSFAEDNILCGVDSTEYPQPLPGADVERWHSPRLVLAEHDNTPQLLVGEQLLACVVTVAPWLTIENDNYLTVPRLFYEGGPESIMGNQVFGSLSIATAGPINSVWDMGGRILRYARTLEMRLVMQGLDFIGQLDRFQQAVNRELTALRDGLTNLGRTVTELEIKTTHDRGWVFDNPQPKPLVPTGGNGAGDEQTVLTYTVPPGPYRNYLFSGTLSLQESGPTPNVSLCIYVDNQMLMEQPFAKLASGQTQVVSLDAYRNSLPPGTVVTLRLRRSTNGTNRASMFAATLTYDGLPV